jgi:hypothetical protein
MKFQHLLIASLATFAMVACETPGGVTPDGTYTIEVDKTVIEANGEDVATFVVKDSAGNDLTADEEMLSKIYFIDAVTEARLPRETRTFSSIRNGEYTFYASVKGQKSSNTVTIKVQNRKLYETFLQKVCLIQLTGTWCTNCPSMTAALNEFCAGEYGKNIVLTACHFNDKYAINVNGKDLASSLFLNFGFTTGAVPNLVYDMSYIKGDRAQYAITSYITEILSKTPATCGVKISSANIDASGNVTIEAAVKADKDATYDLAWAVLADNQNDASGNEPVYNEVIVAASNNFIKMGSDKVALTKGQEHTKTFTTKVTDYAAKDLKVVVFAHSNAHGAQMIDNANECAMGGSVDYVYNE